MKYDVFLSYKSEDHEWVEGLKRSLQQRGVSVWLDKDAIRPGDLFAEALEDGIDSSGHVAVVVTPQSMKSQWVKEEYYRALSLSADNAARIIPCILEKTKVPGFLSSRQYIDFTDSASYERNVDRLVCPGITGRVIHIQSFTHNGWPSDWDRLNACCIREIGFDVRGGLSDSRMGEFTFFKQQGEDVSRYGIVPNDSMHSVVLIDMSRHGIQMSVEFILECRESKGDRCQEIVFVFYHPPGFIQGLDDSVMSKELKRRFSHYYVIEKAEDANTLTKNVRYAWNQVLQDLIRAEKRNMRSVR